ncbi:hypothetical protein [Actinoplanes sp. G11-F43]|uniref:hypothetical protein n=1 Tax=Actinoplanes sp. G11-F43 TaxID=3424130 RepID=UPI003D34E074
MSVLEQLQQAAELTAADADDPEALFDTAALNTIVKNAAGRLHSEFLVLQAAAEVVTRDEPLATTRHNGERWAGKLSPSDVVDLAAAAPEVPASVSYLRGRNNLELAAATELSCDGGAQKKRCNGTRVRLADGTRAASCWPHLPPAVKAAIRAERDQALQQACPFCSAPAGHQCVDPDGIPTTIHNHRLRPGATRRRS